MLENHGVRVQLVPAGMIYYNYHQPRSQVCVKYGQPIQISDELYSIYKQDKSKAINLLAEKLKNVNKQLFLGFKSINDRNYPFWYPWTHNSMQKVLLWKLKVEPLRKAKNDPNFRQCFWKIKGQSHNFESEGEADRLLPNKEKSKALSKRGSKLRACGCYFEISIMLLLGKC